MTTLQIQREELEEDQSCSDIRYAEELRDIRQHCDETLGREPQGVTYIVEGWTFHIGGVTYAFVIYAGWALGNIIGVW